MTFSPPAPPAFADCTPRQKAARVLTEALAPANLGVRRGALTDQHIRVRRQRAVPMGLSLVSVVAGICLLRLLGAPATCRWRPAP